MMNNKLWGAVAALGAGVAAYFLFFRPSTTATAGGYFPPARGGGGGSRRTPPPETEVPTSDPGGSLFDKPIFFRHAETGVPQVYTPFMQRTANEMIRIASQSDAVGTLTGYASATARDPSVDTRISGERAATVRAVLVGLGVPADRLDPVAGGPTNQFGVEEAKNRRVVLS
jgi:hypothetical protein